MQVGDIVEPNDPESGQQKRVLHSGWGIYPDAVVASVEPFVLISKETDMLWSCTWEPDELHVTGHACDSIKKDVAKRLKEWQDD